MSTERQIQRFSGNSLLIRHLHFFSTKKGIIQSPDMQITTPIQKASVYESVTCQNAVILAPILFAVNGGLILHVI